MCFAVEEHSWFLHQILMENFRDQGEFGVSFGWRSFALGVSLTTQHFNPPSTLGNSAERPETNRKGGEIRTGGAASTPAVAGMVDAKTQFRLHALVTKFGSWSKKETTWRFWFTNGCLL